jgi:hypothetical protein
MENEVRAYLQAIYTDYHNRNVGSNPLTLEIKAESDKEFLERLSVNEGKAYLKVVSQGGAHSFIVKEDGPNFKKGDILKAASWASPAKNYARGNIFDAETIKAVRYSGI